MARTLQPEAANVARTLISRGHHGVVVTQDRPTRTAAEAAATLGVDIGAITKSLVFLLDDEPVLLLVSSSHQVDTERTGKRLEGMLTRAPAELVVQVTGQPLGGVAPVGHPTNLSTYIDTALEAYPELWAAAGHPGAMFRTTFRELVRITAGLAIDVD
ncbi:YbaK/EbsC family protein [Rhodococcus sp. NPDC058532]|uniref:YbaK/EbsC family protein n=1 Tax=Rhodococcus sp. NPDC058532 TaxID=3346540 RepID=UPI00365999B3